MFNWADNVFGTRRIASKTNLVTSSYLAVRVGGEQLLQGDMKIMKSKAYMTYKVYVTYCSFTTPFWCQFFLSCHLLTLVHMYLSPYYSFSKPSIIFLRAFVFNVACLECSFTDIHMILSLFRYWSNVISTGSSSLTPLFSTLLPALFVFKVHS